MFDTNVSGVIYGSKAVVEHFKRGVPGALINVGSLLDCYLKLLR
nr:hypothetical protein [Pueribacillus theae]